ncbi:MAG: trigger factor [Bacteroidales bacterium]|jgi:trigger factor|nr:trigger factor [Bacteroidales bacterium]
MNIVKEQAGNSSVQLKVNIVESDYKDLVRKELNKVRNQIQMPGFRKGHAPQGLVQKMYGQSIMIDEVNKLLQERVGQFLEDEKMDILGHPFPAENTPPIDFDKDVDFNFTIDVIFAPKADLGFLKTMPTTYYTIKITDKLIDEQVASYRQRFGGMEETKGKIKEKDYLRCDYQSVGNPDFSGTTFFYIDEKMHPGSEKFIGHKFGDTIEVDVEEAAGDDLSKAGNLLNLSAEEQNEAKGVFKFTINEVKRRKDAPLNQSLFEKGFPNKEISTEAEFRNAIAEMHAKVLSETVDIWFFNTNFEQILDKAHLEYDDNMLRRYINHQRRVDHDKEHHHDKDGHCEDVSDQEYENIKKGTSWELIQAKIMEECDIKVDKEDLRRSAKEKVCRYFGLDPNLPDDQLNYIFDIVDNLMKEQDQLKELFQAAVDKKITQALKEHTKMTIKEVTWEEFVKIAEAKKEPVKKATKTGESKKAVAETEEKPKTPRKRKKADDKPSANKE